MYEDEAIKNKKDIVLDLSDTEATAKICKALSSETRLEILKCLVDKSMTISELAEAFYLPMSSMCLHIKTLSEANLITVVPKPGTARFPEALRHQDCQRNAGYFCPFKQADAQAARLCQYADRSLQRLSHPPSLRNRLCSFLCIL